MLRGWDPGPGDRIPKMVGKIWETMGNRGKPPGNHSETSPEWSYAHVAMQFVYKSAQNDVIVAHNHHFFPVTAF